MSHQHYQILGKNPANYIPLSPLSFIRHTGMTFAEHTSVIYGDCTFTWEQTYQRCVQLASALNQRGIVKGDTVSVISPNIPAMIEAHFGIPMAGAVLNAINIRLDSTTIAYILQHSDCKLVFVDAQFIDEVIHTLAENQLTMPVICINDPQANFLSDLGDDEYENFIAQGNKNYSWKMPNDEWQAIALNYTSGTSGRPKGVVYHHRGSYLMSMGTLPICKMNPYFVYLCIVPLFHCNGWGHAWTTCLAAGTMVCCRNVNAHSIFSLIVEHRVTHFGGVPIVLGMLVNATKEEKAIAHKIDHKVTVITAGAAPPPTILQSIEAMGFDVIPVYGLTETYGHVTYCLWKEQWDNLPAEERAVIKSWQGTSFPMNEETALFNLDTAELIEANSDTQESISGEIVMRGNTIMKGYYKDPDANAKAFDKGWFHSGDIATWQRRGYMKIKDRLKDIIISGGENISSIEVEAVLYKHSAVANAAVVAKADEKWGEVPIAFIELKQQYQNNPPTLQEIQAFCRQHMASFKIPKQVIYRELPKTATGKIQKFRLRNSL